MDNQEPIEAAEIEAERRASIRQLALFRVGAAIVGDFDEGEERLTKTVVDITLSIVDIAVALINKGVMPPSDFSQRLRDLNTTATAMGAARDATRDAIVNGDDIETFRTTPDAIIPPV